MIPPPTVFDPSDPAPGALPERPGGTVVLLLVSSADREWAAATALELGAHWARGGRRIVLADLSLENPVLHERAGIANLEGIVDVFLYGTSLARSAKRVRGGGFYLIPAGTYTADPDAVFRHPRWAKLVSGFQDANATLLLFAPAEPAGVQALATWASAVVALGEPDEWTRDELEGRRLPVGVVLAPPGRPQRPAAPPVISSRIVSARDEGLVLPPPPVREPKPERRGVALLLWLLLGLVLLAAVGYAVARARPGLLPWATPAGERGTLPSDSGITPLPAPPSPIADPLPYSVQAKAFVSIDAAGEQLANDQARLADVPFFITPEADSGVLYYKILAGTLADTVAANRLRERLVSAGSVDPEDAVGAWSLIQHRPLAFEIGEYPTREAARAAADSLRPREIFPYAVPVAYSDGSERWRLYAGAYRDSATAEPLREAIAAAGLTPRLVPRIGRAAVALDG